MHGIELTPEHPPARVAELAATAEAEGFDAVFASCHYNNRDPFVALDRVAAATERVRLGPGVANPYQVHPVALASAMATLDEASGGRGVFGVGAGDRSTLANLGVERDRPLRRVLETVQVARRLWAGERVTHDGTFRARDAGLNYEAGEIPVYVGAQGPGMLRMAGEHADGVLVNAAHPRDVEWAAARVAEGIAERRGSGGEAAVDGEPGAADDVDVVAFASVSVAADSAAARAAARRPVAFIAAGAEPPVLERHGVGPAAAAAVGEAVEAGEFSAADDRVTDAMLDAFCAAGTVADVAERVAALLEHADGVVVAAPLGPDVEEAIGLAATALDRATG